MEKLNDLSVKVIIQVYEKQSYNNKDHVLIQKDCNTNLTTDSSKRKIIDKIEDFTEELLREASDLIHHSKNLTDGDIERESKRNQE